MDTTLSDAKDSFTLKSLRKLKQKEDRTRFSIQAVASRAGITTGYLSLIERGKRYPRKQETIQKLAEALEEPVEVIQSLLYTSPARVNRIFQYLQEFPGLFQLILFAVKHRFNHSDIARLLHEARLIVDEKKLIEIKENVADTDR